MSNLGRDSPVLGSGSREGFSRRLEMREVEGSMGGGGGWEWGVLVFLVHIIRQGLRLGFKIWVGIPLFWAIAPVRALA